MFTKYCAAQCFNIRVYIFHRKHGCDKKKNERTLLKKHDQSDKDIELHTRKRKPEMAGLDKSMRKNKRPI